MGIEPTSEAWKARSKILETLELPALRNFHVDLNWKTNGKRTLNDLTRACLWAQDALKPRWSIETIEAFDQFLRDRGLRFDAVVIGGAALSLLGIVSRPTKDIDILAPEIPPEI